MGSEKKKKKKKKTVYVDDGRTVADMSGLYGQRSRGAKGTVKDQARTYFEAMKMMFIPMLVTIGIISVAFFIAWLLLLA